MAYPNLKKEPPPMWSISKILKVNFSRLRGWIFVKKSSKLSSVRFGFLNWSKFTLRNLNAKKTVFTKNSNYQLRRYNRLIELGLLHRDQGKILTSPPNFTKEDSILTWMHHWDRKLHLGLVLTFLNSSNLVSQRDLKS